MCGGGGGGGGLILNFYFEKLCVCAPRRRVEKATTSWLLLTLIKRAEAACDVQPVNVETTPEPTV